MNIVFAIVVVGIICLTAENKELYEMNRELKEVNKRLRKELNDYE